MLGKMLATHSKNYQSNLVREVTENQNLTSVTGEMNLVRWRKILLMDVAYISLRVKHSPGIRRARWRSARSRNYLPLVSYPIVPIEALIFSSC